MTGPTRQASGNANENWHDNINPVIVKMEHLAEVVQKMYGPAMRPIGRLVYMKPYPECINRLCELPRGYKIPEFTLLSRDDNQSTIEHIGQFMVQVEEASSNGFQKLLCSPTH